MGLDEGVPEVASRSFKDEDSFTLLLLLFLYLLYLLTFDSNYHDLSLWTPPRGRIERAEKGELNAEFVLRRD